MTKRRTEITVETERLLVAERHTTTRVWCVRCGLDVETAPGTEQESTDGTARSARPREAGADAVRGGRNQAQKSGENSPGS
ncbi:MAG TPA: hypothetical protein VJ715_08445 [Pyrinomonadaceae bacterium]|nr:hypothetical protein [Pyrinomonadaceae bacterium]